MKRKVFAGSAVAAALLFQLTAVGFPAYAAEYDAVQKEEFVSSFSDAETKQVAQYLVDNCKDTYGYDDGDGDGILDCVGIKCDAVPILVGDTNKYLVNQNIKNGSFESNLSEWQQNGNVNTKLKLGSITPESGKRMAFITTRTNESAESSVEQSFKVPSYASTISFTYDVISDEPMEWVNEGYNDTFNAYLVTSDGTVSLATESTDTSNWVRITDVNLPDGDNTTYHTGKIKVTYNISALRGKNVKLVFVVKDSGDNTYDTAAVVDNVTLTK